MRSPCCCGQKCGTFRNRSRKSAALPSGLIIADSELGEEDGKEEGDGDDGGKKEDDDEGAEGGDEAEEKTEE